MNDVQEPNAAESTTVFPALIQVQGMPGVMPATSSGKRRIWVLLDHPVARQLGLFSWLLVVAGLAAARPRMAVFVGAMVLIGLLIGIVNGARWLFGRNSRRL